jgi:hypothetical protein
MEKIVTTILLFLFSVDLNASEEFCALDNQDVKSSAREGHDRSS